MEIQSQPAMLGLIYEITTVRVMTIYGILVLFKATVLYAKSPYRKKEKKSSNLN
jgi:hypothetical protein